MKQLLFRQVCVVAIGLAACLPAAAQSPVRSQDARNGGRLAAVSVVPAEYVIGIEDVLSIVFWGESALSTDVVVRPDGKISVPLLKDVKAAGYTPEQLTDVIAAAATKFISQPSVTVIVKDIRSRRVFVVGQVAKPGTYPLIGQMTVLQLIATAGDVQEYAKAKDVIVVRHEDGREVRFKFNYREVVKGIRPEQDILLKPGDTVIVP